MAWFSPIKGSYPSLGQVDKTLPVAAGSEAVERGMVVALTADNQFELAEDASKPLYIALQNYGDRQAFMAGLKGVPSITGLYLAQDGEYQTDAFTGTIALGDKLTVANGKFKKAGEGDTAVAIATAAPFKRWVNDAHALEANAERTGDLVEVLQFVTL